MVKLDKALIEELEQALDEIACQLMWNHVLKPFISLKVFSEERLLIAAAKWRSVFGNVEWEWMTI